MATVKEKMRIYKGPDAYMIEASRTMHSIFTEDLQIFTKFDNTFTENFATAWLSKIENAAGVINDAQPLGEQAESTRLAELKMEEARRYYKQVKYFIEKAFPGKHEIWTRFGINEYLKVRKSETRMIQFLLLLYKGMHHYKADLINAGLNEVVIEEANTLMEQLSSVNYNREITKKIRPALTLERIDALNACYEQMQIVARAAKIIFAGNYAKYKQYLLPANRTGIKTRAGEDTPSE